MRANGIDLQGIAKDSIILRQHRVNYLRHKILGEDNNKQDYLIKDTTESVYADYKKYSLPKMSSAIVDLLNFDYNKCEETEDEVIVGGMKYLKEQIPEIDIKRCDVIKAVNNKIKMNSGHYYKFSDDNGKTHVLACAYGWLKQPTSETWRENVDKESCERVLFWNMMVQDATYLGLHYSEDLQKEILNETGITQGFFSVEMDNNYSEYYYSNGNAGAVISKLNYDVQYEYFTSELAFDDFKVGSVITIGGKEYVLGSDRKLDIAYGEDIFDIVYPPIEQRE
ncbi:MAG: hypothetical protein UH654_08485 [Lachnospiraceae bacterium]|nr:hypothetical protein [Lachnospiraceae bacterium]MEE0960050.1 hypothetical protein [Lachnospiraceae bacterium]